MHLEDQAEASVAETRHQICATGAARGPAAPTALRRSAGGTAPATRVRAPFGGHGHVAGDVESVVVHRRRLRQPQRREREPLAEARDAREPRGDLRPEGLDRRRETGPAGGSKRPLQATCMWALGVSSRRNEPSREVRRVMPHMFGAAHFDFFVAPVGNSVGRVPNMVHMLDRRAVRPVPTWTARR